MSLRVADTSWSPMETFEPSRLINAVWQMMQRTNAWSGLINASQKSLLKVCVMLGKELNRKSFLFSV